jgi:hypothetical protein
MKVLVVQNKKEWLQSDYADGDEFIDMAIEEDKGLPPQTYYIKEA